MSEGGVHAGAGAGAGGGAGAMQCREKEEH